MEKQIKILIDFVSIFIIIFLIYKFIFNKRRKDYNKLSKSDSVRLFIKKYNLNIKKHNYKKILNFIAIIDSFILSLTSVVVLSINSLIWSIIIGFVMVMLLIYSFYEIYGKYLKRKEEE